METETREIGGVTFEIAPVPPKKGRRALTRLINRVAPVLADLLEGQDVGSDQEVDVLDMDVSAALRRLAGELTEDDVDYFCDLFQDYTKVVLEEGNPAVRLASSFDDVFTQRYDLLMKWLWACLEVNFSGFFGDFGGSAQGALAAVRQAQGRA